MNSFSIKNIFIYQINFKNGDKTNIFSILDQMKYFKLILLLLVSFIVQAQDSQLLIHKTPVTNLSEYPIYSHLISDTITLDNWKPEYKYLDSIDIYKITYLSDGLKINGLLVKPKKLGNYPCIIYNRGGNRDFGFLKIAHGAITLGQVAKEGYVVIASQYRGNAGGEGQEEFGGSEVNDITILTEVLKEIEGANTESIGMYGWSRGGMMTYISLTKTDKIKAAVVGGALSDAFSNIKDRPTMETNVMAELIPNYNTNKERELTKRSAIKWADKFPKDVPILILHVIQIGG